MVKVMSHGIRGAGTFSSVSELLSSALGKMI